MNQQILASASQTDNFLKTPARLANRCLSIVVSFSNGDQNSKGNESDVRFVCSNTSALDVRIYVDEDGELHTRFRKVNTSKMNMPPIANDYERPQLESEAQYEEVSLKPDVVTKRGRGRPKGSKNKPKLIDKTRSIVKEMFETNEEFKARKAEELKLLST